MPAGRTHDQITLACLPLTVALAFLYSRSPLFALICGGGFLFSGLMFGPDLDIPSCQYRRWGWLRWLWLPYQKSLRHRSLWSHGFLIGTVLRLIYLGCWLILLAAGAGMLFKTLGYWRGDWAPLLAMLRRWLLAHPQEGLALWLGLEAGAMSHSCSDWLGSTFRRWGRPARLARSSRSSHHSSRNRSRDRRARSLKPTATRAASASKARVFRTLTHPSGAGAGRSDAFHPRSGTTAELEPLSIDRDEPGVQYSVQDLGRYPR
jgi:uncharacterized metal-binding protein